MSALLACKLLRVQHGLAKPNLCHKWIHVAGALLCECCAKVMLTWVMSWLQPQRGVAGDAAAAEGAGAAEAVSNSPSTYGQSATPQSADRRAGVLSIQ